jgi:hypothetical protein
LFVGDGEFAAENKVGEGIFVEDIVAVNGFSGLLEINAVVFCPEAIKNSSAPVELTEIPGRLLEPGVRKAGDEVDEVELLVFLARRSGNACFVC